MTARGPPGGRSGGFARRKWQLVSNTFEVRWQSAFPPVTLADFYLPLAESD